MTLHKSCYNLPFVPTLTSSTLLAPVMSQPGDKFTWNTTAQEVADAFPGQIEGRYSEYLGFRRRSEQ